MAPDAAPPTIRHRHRWLHVLRRSVVIALWLALPALAVHIILPWVEQAPYRHLLSHIALGIAIFLAFYAAACYLVIPRIWRFHARRWYHPGMAAAPTRTTTGEGLPGDPLNIALIGTQAKLASAMQAAGWLPADPLSFHTGLHIAADGLIGRPYTHAPVSSLFLWGRVQDLAFEQPVGDNPRHRHHVRFWQSPNLDEQGRPLWVGAATYDRSVGLSHKTGQVTHHIAPDIDTERNKLIADLRRAGQIADAHFVPGITPEHSGHNGGGDPFYTDGDVALGILTESQRTRPAVPGQEAPGSAS